MKAEKQFAEVVGLIKEAQGRAFGAINVELTLLSWSHHMVIMSRGKSAEEREFYIRLSSRERYGVRELERQISSGVYERVMMGNEKLPASMRRDRMGISDAFKSDYVLEFLNLPTGHSESDLQKGLILQRAGPGNASKLRSHLQIGPLGI